MWPKQIRLSVTRYMWPKQIRLSVTRYINTCGQSRSVSRRHVTINTCGQSRSVSRRHLTSIHVAKADPSLGDTLHVAQSRSVSRRHVTSIHVAKADPSVGDTLHVAKADPSLGDTLHQYMWPKQIRLSETRYMWPRNEQTAETVNLPFVSLVRFMATCWGPEQLSRPCVGIAVQPDAASRVRTSSEPPVEWIFPLEFTQVLTPFPPLPPPPKKKKKLIRTRV